MKNILYKGLMIGVSVLSMMLYGCNDDYLNRVPETSITEANFFKSDTDLELYSNRFYSYFYFSDFTGVTQGDNNTDNVLAVNTTDGLYTSIMSGTLSPTTVSKWGWGDIRDVNFLIARADNAEGSDVPHFKGLARLTRAMLYYAKVVAYSDVPWYSRDLKTNDDELLYKTQDSREMVCDSILNDLDYAIANMHTAADLGGDHTYITKDVALALKARICLNEASWRKYHSELGLSDADRFYNLAISACEELMGMGYQLSSDYMTLFRNTSLKDNKEAILYIDYDLSNNIMWSYGDAFLANNGGLSRDLFDSYLYIDGDQAVPFTSRSGYSTMSYSETFQNRDPRLTLCFTHPNYCRPQSPETIYNNALSYGGIKWEPMENGGNTNGYSAGNVCYGDVARFRYAEILLIYAEAKAELGTLTQSDLDKSINLLRARVGMPTATLSDWLSDIDPVLEAKYSNVSSTQKGAVLEIRRERRIELLCEGFRYQDLFRWKLGKIFEDQGKGYYIGTTLPAGIDLDEDGQEDFMVFATTEQRDAYTGSAAVKYVAGVDNFRMTDDGYIRPIDADGIYTFTEPKCYYTPISSQDILINPNLKQNPNWE